MKCHGRCQMMKKMQQEEKKDQQTPERKSEKTLDQYCSIQSIAHILFTEISGGNDLPVLTTTGNPVKMPRSLLRPPAC